jgi:two-component system, NarL family, sensor histidine kinase UhpB
MPDPRAPRRRYVPLVLRVLALNAGLLIAAVVVTLLVLEPHRIATVAVDEAIVLILALALVASINLILLRRVLGPIATLTALVREVDLGRPGTRMPVGDPASEAGELSLSFNQMLDRLQAERREATARVLAGQESERLRIAQELHDQIGQELTAVLLGLARVHALTDPTTRPVVQEIQDAVRTSLEDVRRIALELRPEALDELGLVSAIAVLGERLHERAGMTVHQTIDPALPDLEPDVELVVYRVAQEALTNVARHAGTPEAELRLGLADSAVVLEVSDRGRGLPDGAAPGTGVRGMQERATLIGGRLELGPGDGGRGCRVRLTVGGVPAPPPLAGSVRARHDPADDPHPAR